MTKSVILTVVGSDRPGLTQALADAVLEAGGNWLESHLAKLGGKYVGSVLVELPAANMPALEAAARRIDSLGLSVTMLDAVPDPQPAAGRAVRLELVGQDRPGIVREVTAVLAELRVNIEELTSSVENSSWSGARLFRANAALQLPPGVTLDMLQDALERISGEIMADINLSPEGGTVPA